MIALTRTAVAAAMLVSSGLAFAEEAPTYQVVSPPAAARIQVSGTIKVVATLQTSASLSPGTAISFNARAVVSDTSYSGEASKNGTANVASGKATITLILPYTWLVASTADKVNVYLTASGSKSTSITYSHNVYIIRTIALPANNATTTVTIAGSL